MTHTLPTPTPAAVPVHQPHRRVEPETWASARADYEGGASAPVMAERYGLGERHVRRRAAQEGWRRSAASAEAGGAGLGELRARLSLALAAARADGHAERDADAHLHELVEGEELELGRLLMRPEPEGLARLAFRRAAEAAARGTPAEALSWLRVVAALDRSAPTLRRAARPHDAASYQRAAWAGMLDQLADRVQPDQTRAFETLDAELDDQDAARDGAV